MSQLLKLINKLLLGQSDNNFDFDELIKILKYFDFELRIKGSHHVFTKLSTNILFNLQKDGKLAKNYQVKQVRKYILKVLLTEGNKYEI